MESEVKAVGFIIEYTLIDGHKDRSRMFLNDKHDKYAHTDTYMTLIQDRTVKQVKTLRILQDGSEKESNFHRIHSAFMRVMLNMARSQDTKDGIQSHLDVLDENEYKQYKGDVE
jgi:hypothetical protein